MKQKEDSQIFNNYGLTEKGRQALRNAADPDRPHTMADPVITESVARLRLSIAGLDQPLRNMTFGGLAK